MLATKGQEATKCSRDAFVNAAINLVVERFSIESQDDRDDLVELFKILLESEKDSEEHVSAVVAMSEILEQGEGAIQRMDLEADNTPTKWSKHVGTCIRRLRDEKGWTQDDLAKRAGLSSQSYVCRLESGAHSPSALTVEKVANALEVNPSELDPCYRKELEDDE